MFVLNYINSMNQINSNGIKYESNNLNSYQQNYQPTQINANELMNKISALATQFNNNQICINNIQSQNANNQLNSNPSMFVGNLRRVPGLNENSKKLHISNNPFKIKLKSHQEALLYRVLELDDKASKTSIPFGIMSDKPGSGKTFVILAMIYYSIKFFNSQGANIIVVPHNIYTQWVNAINNFLGKTLKFVCLIDYNEINRLYTNSSILYNNDLIITTPLMYDIFAGAINSLGLQVQRIFFDEADSMGKILTHSINSKMTWFVSASISNVFDPISLKAKIGNYELYLPTLLTNECWCETEFIDSNIKLPKPHIEKFICKDFYIDLILSNVLEHEYIKYINGLDYSNIRQECGGHLIKTNQEIVKYLFEYSNKMVTDTNEVLKDLEKSRVEAPDTRAKTLRKKQIYTQRQEKIKFLAHKYNLCIECFEYIEDIVCKKTPCNDFICSKCIPKQSKCMTCNKSHPENKMEDEKVYHNSKVKDFIDKSVYNKFVILDKILEVCGSKVILYSEFGGLNGYLKNYSIDYNIKVVELNGGNIKDVDKILISFRDDPNVKILLIDNAYFGVGLNIEYTTDMIFFHNIEISLKTQLIGRAQRFGRKSKLNIWEIKHWNEEPELQQMKSNKKYEKKINSDNSSDSNDSDNLSDSDNSSDSSSDSSDSSDNSDSSDSSDSDSDSSDSSD